MLKRLQKFFNPASAEAQEKEDVDMTTENEQATLAAENSVAELATQVATLTASQTEATETIAKLTAALADSEAKLAAADAVKAQFEADAVAQRVQARTDAIVKAVGTGKVEALLAATSDLDDKQFNTIVSAMAASVDAESKTEMFSEQGVTTPEATVAEQPTHFKTYIKGNK